MSELSVSIKKYIDNVIRLSAKDIQDSASSRDWFLKRIQNEIENRTNDPILYATEPFIRFGSYFKGTKVSDADEYDILVVIDSCNGQYTNNGQIIGKGEGTAFPNHKYDKRFYKSDDSGVSSKKIVWWLQGIVQEVVNSFGGEPTIEDGISVTAEIKTQNIKLDLVPCGVFQHVTKGKQFYNIGNGNDSWTLTNPSVDIDRLSNIANGKDDFKNIIRICKRIKDQYGLQISSFTIETAIANYAESITNASWNMCNVVGRTIGCMEALAGSIQTGHILDNWNKNLLEEAINYQADANSYATIATVLRSREILIRCRTQDSLDNFVESLFENKG